MKAQTALCAVVLAIIFGATAQPVTAGPPEEAEKCVASIVTNRPVTVNISGNKFTCPGHIIVAEENEVQKLPGYSGTSAYFKGALNGQGGTSVRYFVTIENHANPQTCRVLAGPMTIADGELMTVRAGNLSGSWDDKVNYLVTASVKRWADTYEWKGCRRGTASGGGGTTTVTLSPNPQNAGPLPYVGTWGPITGARPTKLWLASIGLGDYALHFLRAGRTNNDCWTPSAVVILSKGGSLDSAAISQIQGGSPAAGQKLTFVACYSSQPAASPSSVTFNLDWTK